MTAILVVRYQLVVTSTLHNWRFRAHLMKCGKSSANVITFSRGFKHTHQDHLQCLRMTPYWKMCLLLNHTARLSCKRQATHWAAQYPYNHNGVSIPCSLQRSMPTFTPPNCSLYCHPKKSMELSHWLEPMLSFMC